MIKVHPYQFFFEKEAPDKSKVTTCISLYNYQQHIIETLDSVCCQTLANIDLVIVEDCSTDDSLAVVEDWIKVNEQRFNTIYLVQHMENQGLSGARNTAVSISSTPYVFILDADNLLYPRCIERCVEALETDERAAVAYPIIEKFGEEHSLIGNVVWNPERFKRKNYIDAMSLVRKDALYAVDGYSELAAVGKLGWEDYELWCKFIDNEFYGVPVQEVLARYRTHADSMLNSISNKKENIARLHNEMMMLHPWLELSTAPAK